MNSVNKTLYIPLFGKALVSKKGVILQDKKAEEIWESEKFALKGKSKSKWLAYFMGMRSAVFDKWVEEELKLNPTATVLQLGCGLDSRAERVKADYTSWYDIDFETVINERKKYYTETDNYKMLSGDLVDTSFINSIPCSNHAIVVIEGVSMYLTNEQMQNLLSALGKHFSSLSVLVDCYTPFGAKMSKIKNPINEVGKIQVYGIANPQVLEQNTSLVFSKEYELTPDYLIEQLQGMERKIFKTVFAGKTSKKIYKMYEYKTK